MTVRCSNSACGKVFSFTPSGGTTTTKTFGAGSKDIKSYPAACPHCGRVTIVTR